MCTEVETVEVLFVCKVNAKSGRFEGISLDDWLKVHYE